MNDDGAGKEVSVEMGPSGVKGSAKGYHLGNILQLLLAAVATAGILILYDLRAETKATNEKLQRAMIDDHDKIRLAVEKLVDAQDETNYIMTLSTEDRERLNIGMPESLRRKTGHGVLRAPSGGRRFP